MGVPQPFLSGKDAKFRLYMDDGTGKLGEVILTAKTWSFKKNVTKTADGVDGEDRDRLGVITNYFEMTASCMTTSADQVEAFILDQANDDAQATPLDKAGRIRLKVIGGKAKNFLLSELVMDDFDLGQGDRAERLMVNISLRFRYFTKTKSV